MQIREGENITDRISSAARDYAQAVTMSPTETKIRYAIGSAAAAAAIFAPLSYKWKGVLTAVAADAILTGVFGYSPIRRLVRA